MKRVICFLTAVILLAALCALAPLTVYAGTTRQLEYDFDTYDYRVHRPLEDTFRWGGTSEEEPVATEYVRIRETHKTTGEENNYRLVVEIQNFPRIEREVIYSEWVAGTLFDLDLSTCYFGGPYILDAGIHQTSSVSVNTLEDIKYYYANHRNENNRRYYEDGTFLGRPALILRDKLYTSIIVHLNEVELPLGLATLEIQMLCIRPSDGYWRSDPEGMEEMRAHLAHATTLAQARMAQLEQEYSQAIVTCYFEGDTLTGSYLDEPLLPGGGHVQRDTSAGETPGLDSSLAVPIAIVLGVAGLAAAAVAVGTGVAASRGARRRQAEQEQQRPSQFFLEVYKDHGDIVKAGAASFQVNARMVEQPPDGARRERPDLTGQVRIYTRDPCVQVGPPAFVGGWMAAMVQGVAVPPPSPQSCVVHFLFTGAGGSFQNNMHFRYIGESAIDFPRGTSLFALAGAGRQYGLPCIPRDFSAPPEISVNVLGPGEGFALEPQWQPDGSLLLVVTTEASAPEMAGLTRNSACEVIAQNTQTGEYARGLFEVVLCREGLVADFLGKPRQVCGAKDEKGNMPATRILFRLGVWNEATKQLDYARPAHLDADYTEDSGVFVALGITVAADTSALADGGVYVDVNADKPFPALQPMQGRLAASCEYDHRSFTFEELLPLTPDVQQYTSDLNEEYLRCRYIIETYVPESWRKKKLEELERERVRKGFGLKDYQLFRKRVWQFAQTAILLEKQNYLDEARAAEDAIFYLEIAVWVGDVAFDIAVGAVSGPIGGFLMSQAKSSFIDLVNLYREKGMSTDMLWAFITNRVTQTLGSADGLVEMPTPQEKKKLAVWLTGFFLYRFGWHFMFTTDEHGNPAGFTGALTEAAKDITGKAVGILLAGYVDKAAEKSPAVKAMAGLKQKDVEFSKPATDLGAKAFDKSYDAMAQFAQVLSDYLRSFTG